MAELAYWEVYAMNRVEARRRLVQTYQRTRNYSETARLWHTSRPLGLGSRRTLLSRPNRRENPHFQEPELSANLELVEGLRSIAQKSDRTIAQLAIAWVLRRPEVTAAIVGARRPSQVEETVVAGEWVLSKEDMAAVQMLLDKGQEALRMPRS